MEIILYIHPSQKRNKIITVCRIYKNKLSKTKINIGSYIYVDSNYTEKIVYNQET